MKQIIVNVVGLTIEEKRLVNEALAKIKDIRTCNPMHWYKVVVMYGPSADSINVGFVYHKGANQTHTPQQVLEMAGMEKQGHAHAESMAMYAQDAKTHSEPWKLWQATSAGVDQPWSDLTQTPFWNTLSLYRRKPKTHTVNGVEVPDLRIQPKDGEPYYSPNPTYKQQTLEAFYENNDRHNHRSQNLLCYEHSEDGKQSAILHAKAWLGIA